MYIAAWLLAGLLLGAGFVRYAQARRRGAHRVLAAGLLVAAMVYVPFAMRAPNVLPWLAVELAGIGVFAALGMMGLRSSPWWLAAGWSLILSGTWLFITLGPASHSRRNGMQSRA